MKAARNFRRRRRRCASLVRQDGPRAAPDPGARRSRHSTRRSSPRSPTTPCRRSRRRRRSCGVLGHLFSSSVGYAAAHVQEGRSSMPTRVHAVPARGFNAATGADFRRHVLSRGNSEEPASCSSGSWAVDLNALLVGAWPGRAKAAQRGGTESAEGNFKERRAERRLRVGAGLRLPTLLTCAMPQRPCLHRSRRMAALAGPIASKEAFGRQNVGEPAFSSWRCRQTINQPGCWRPCSTCQPSIAVPVNPAVRQTPMKYTGRFREEAVLHLIDKLKEATSLS